MANGKGIVVIGVSQGGLNALKVLLSSLFGNFPLPIAIVQHREKNADETLTMLLQKCTTLKVKEAEDKEMIQPGTIYLAPADYHLLVEDTHFSLSVDEPVWFCRPAIDVLFESVANAYQERVIGIILTGANEDGARGLLTIKRYGGLTIVQDPNTAENPRMPEAAIKACLPDKILPIEEIGNFLAEISLD